VLENTHTDHCFLIQAP